jgi:ribosomal protein L7/L12
MSRFQVQVTAVGPRLVPMLKTLRLVADLGLVEAQGLADHLRGHVPCVLVAGVARDVAEHAAGLLRAAGASAVVEPSAVTSPMLLCPEAGQRHRWDWLRGPQPA